MIKILFFGTLAQQIGKDSMDITFVEPESISAVLKKIAADFPILNKIHHAVLFAVNHNQVHADHIVQDGDEIAFMPPFAGG